MSKTKGRLDFEAYFKSCNASDTDADLICSALESQRNLRTIESFLLYFSSYSLREWVDNENSTWKNDANKFVALDMALGLARDTADKKKEAEKKLSEEDSTQPMDSDMNKSLIQAWLGMYGYPLHPTQEYTSQILNGMYRGLRTRQGNAKHIQGLKTLEDVSRVGETKNRKRKLDLEFDLVDKTKPLDEDRGRPCRAFSGFCRRWASSRSCG